MTVNNPPFDQQREIEQSERNGQDTHKNKRNNWQRLMLHVVMKTTLILRRWKGIEESVSKRFSASAQDYNVDHRKSRKNASNINPVTSFIMMTDNWN